MIDSMSPVRLRVGRDDYLVVGATDILRIHGRRHAARLLEDEPALTERERYLGLGTAMGISGVAVYTGAHLPW